MALNRLDLNLLHVFDTIYREGSLTRAARALHPTQPGVRHSPASSTHLQLPASHTW